MYDTDFIREIADDEVVAEPGAYRMSMDHYHSQKVCPGPSVSSTGLRKLAMQSPHAFWKTWGGNENRYPEKEPSDSLILGKAAHALILGDEVFDDHFIYVPKDAPRRPTAPQVAAFKKNGEWSEAAKDGAVFWEAFDKKAAGRHLLKEEQVEKIKYMSENLAATPEAVEVLTSDLIEISMIWQDAATGIWVKSRPDCLPSNGYDFGDLKTFAPKMSNLELAAQRAVTDHGYAIQMALAIEGAEQVLGTTAQRCALVFVQTSEPYEVIPVEIDEDAIYWARCLIRLGLNRMAHGLKTGQWPGVAKGITKYSYPPSMLHRFGEMQINGEIPNLEA